MAPSSLELFPPSPREIYEKAPLIEVICQLRFPSLLRIEGELPVEFQERIRDLFPLLEKDVGTLPPDMPPEVAKIIQSQSSVKGYRFLTEDRHSTVTLGTESLALSTNKYIQWEYFLESLRNPISALIEIYNPNFFSRIGLRYQNAIDRTMLGLNDVPWSHLLRAEILGELALPQFESQLQDIASRTLRFALPDGSGSLMMRHGLANVPGHEDKCYFIDLDYFTTKKTEVSDAENTIDHFNALVGSAFRWCITDTLRDALGPKRMENAT